MRRKRFIESRESFQVGSSYRISSSLLPYAEQVVVL